MSIGENFTIVKVVKLCTYHQQVSTENNRLIIICNFFCFYWKQTKNPDDVSKYVQAILEYFMTVYIDKVSTFRATRKLFNFNI